MTTPAPPSYAGYRFPAEIISFAVRLYFRFPLSLRHVDEILAARGIIVSHETVRQWGLKFGQAFANQIRRRLPCAGDKWHLDEVAVKIAGVKHWLWRAVDQDGFVLDVLVQSRRNKAAAERLLRKLLKKQTRPPRVMITDKLPSYAAAKREIMPGVEHRQHKGLNNRAENSHQPTRRRERQMKRFKSAGRHNGSSPPMTGSTTSFIFAVITFLPSSIEPPGPRRSRPGLRSPALPEWHSCQHVQLSSGVSLRPQPIKLTVPRHDFLWRTTRELPERGRIGIFNRSYYEEVLIARVHPEILRNEDIPDAKLHGKGIWHHRYRSILDLERHLNRNGTRIIKFYLHLSKEEQRKRFLERIDQPEKNWKFSAADIKERGFWKQYMAAYEACLAATSTGEAPWYVVPADDKENARLIVSRIILDTLEGLDMAYPVSTDERREELLAIRKELAE